MLRHKTGRRPARHTRRTMKSALVLHAALAALGTPPATPQNYVSAVLAQSQQGWINWWNSQLGDCVCEDSGHELMLVTANAGKIIIPSANDILALYEAVGGYVTDQGCDETSMCEYLMTTGLCGQRSAGTGMLADPTNMDHIRWAVQLFGSCRLGIIVDEQMEEQFSSNQPWTTPAAPNDPNAGGHDVPVVDYDSDYAYVITWGGKAAVAWSLMQNPEFLDEAHASIWPAFVQATGSAPNGLSLSQLLADLPAVDGATPTPPPSVQVA